VYTGDFIAGKKHGYGEERLLNGTNVAGYWEDGKLIRKGK
jgi:MORN repeat